MRPHADVIGPHPNNARTEHAKPHAGTDLVRMRVDLRAFELVGVEIEVEQVNLLRSAQTGDPSVHEACKSKLRRDLLSETLPPSLLQNVAGAWAPRKSVQRKRAEETAKTLVNGGRRQRKQGE